MHKEWGRTGKKEICIWTCKCLKSQFQVGEQSLVTVSRGWTSSVLFTAILACSLMPQVQSWCLEDICSVQQSTIERVRKAGAWLLIWLFPRRMVLSQLGEGSVSSCIKWAVSSTKTDVVVTVEMTAAEPQQLWRLRSGCSFYRMVPRCPSLHKALNFRWDYQV